MGKRDCAKFSSFTHHIKTHLEKVHKISLTLGFLPTPQPPKDPFKADVQTVFEIYANRLADEEEDAGQADEELVHKKLPHGSYKSRFDESLEIDTHYMMRTKSKAKRVRALNELESYYSSHNDDLHTFKNTSDKRLDNPILWWDEVGQKLYPTLYVVALDYLSIPATSCDCERAFSSGRRTVNDDRNRLAGATIEALQLQKNWLRNQAVESHLIDLQRYITREEKSQLTP